jgi:hypothetical protein
MSEENFKKMVGLFNAPMSKEEFKYIVHDCLGLSQPRLAVEFEKGSKTIWNYENGATRIPLDTARHLRNMGLLCPKSKLNVKGNE